MKLPFISSKRRNPKPPVSSAKTGAKTSAGGKGLGLLIALLLAAMLAMAVVYSMVAIQGGYDKEYLGLVGEQRVLSQRISKFAGQANRGLPVTFDQLKKYRDEFYRRFAASSASGERSPLVRVTWPAISWVLKRSTV